MATRTINDQATTTNKKTTKKAISKKNIPTTKKTSTTKTSSSKKRTSSKATNASVSSTGENDKKETTTKKTVSTSTKNTNKKAVATSTVTAKKTSKISKDTKTASSNTRSSSTKKTTPKTAKNNVNTKSSPKAKTSKPAETDKKTTKTAKTTKSKTNTTTKKTRATDTKPKKRTTSVAAGASVGETVRPRKKDKEGEKRGKEKPENVSSIKRSKTKEEQQKKKMEFNTLRATWFDMYMKDELLTLYQMNISRDREDILSQDEQQRLAMFIQAGNAAKILLYSIADELGVERPHVQPTLTKEIPQITEILFRMGYRASYFKRSKTALKKLKKISIQVDEARNVFAEKNLGLVTLIVGRRKRSTSTAAGVDFDDLMAEGMTGLMTAIDRFDPSLGNLFSTPATWWIEQPVRNYLDSKTKTIHMPTHMNNIYKDIHYATRALQAKTPSDAMITDEMIAEYCQSTGRDKITVKKIQEARALQRETISYDTPMGDGENDKPIVDLIASDDDAIETVTSRIGSDEAFNRLVSLIDDDKKREIVRDWYSSLDTSEIVTLSNISRKHCLTKERVRQLKTEAEIELRSKINKIAKEKNIPVFDAALM